ncbi:MAG: DUF192 domain-containing protein [Proteobacteria bacterium]|nr:DUF192 domain-containing protein [Pseudomonadota bacterium]
MKSYNELKVNILEQTSNKSVVFTFGRFQPPTSGHQLLINKVIKEASKLRAEHRIYPSHSQDSKQNPLSHKDKVLYMRKMFPKADIVDDKKAKTPYHVLESLSKEGYKKVYFIVGGDRVSEFKNGMKKYVGKDGYDFDVFEVLSAGKRDPDAEGVVGMSGSKMRKASQDNDFEKFITGVPDKTPKRVTQGLFKAIRKGMGLKESYKESYSVVVVDDPQERAKGLMHETSLDDGKGMLFVFDEQNYHGIWMKDTLIPLDVVWINEDMEIVDIQTLQPHDLKGHSPVKPARYVLEVNANTFVGEVGDILDVNELDTVQSLDESFDNYLTEISKESRRKMARAARRTSKKRAMVRARKKKKMKSSQDIMKASRRAALGGFKKKLLKDREWSALSSTEKENFEKRLKQKFTPARIAKVAQRLMPGIRAKERDRIAKLKQANKELQDSFSPLEFGTNRAREEYSKMTPGQWRQYWWEYLK